MAQFTTVITKSDRVEEMKAYLDSHSSNSWSIVTAADEAEAVEMAKEGFLVSALQSAASLEESDSYDFAIAESEAFEITDSNGVVIGWEVDSL